MISNIRILLADAQPVVRYGLRTVIKTDPLLEIVDETDDGLEALDLVEKHNPDVLIIDVMMPSVSGLEVVRQLRQRSPQTRCLFFTIQDADYHIHEAFRSGVRGYLLKWANKEQILQTIRSVASGQRYVSPDLTDRLVQAYLENVNQFTVADAYEELTTREREILQMVAEGLTNVAIAERVFISARTVEIHRANVMRKLSLKTQSDLIRYAIKHGIIPL
ncbi:MAG: response regulator transcription factor [Proteobacteria bacterium]|nr:MAG: response regulator transcription factor [Pseudomonadota bacterium]